MLKQGLHTVNHAPSLLLSHKPFLAGHVASSRVALPLSTSAATARRGRAASRQRQRQICCALEEAAPAQVVSGTRPPVTVKAVVSVQLTVGGVFAHLSVTQGLDDIGDLLGRSLHLELLSAELDPETGEEKKTVQAYAHKAGQSGDTAKYEASFSVPANFGEIGGVSVRNEHHKEMYLKDIVLKTGDGAGSVTISCRSWLHSKFDNKQDRVFFISNKSYLPSETPSGLQRLRKKELEILRGDGTGERKYFERIYDYDVYNDLGDPDKSDALARPVLGGNPELPYPRRCRTGRPPSKKDPKSEKRADVYVPRDENFSEIKQVTFSTKTLRSVLHALVPSLQTGLVDPSLRFPYFTAIDSLYNQGIPLPKQDLLHTFTSIVPRLVKTIAKTANNVLQFEVPEMMNRDKFSWFRDEEFSRQTLAGLNPLSIQLVTEFPFVSKLDPEIYGPPESCITEELISKQIRGIMSVQEAIKQKKLFMLDYHDLFLPYVNKIRELEGTTLYGSRTVFFLMPEGTLRPLAIELTRPASPTKPQWKQVFTPCWNATGAWLWKLAKTHAMAHDSGFHQLVSHWLRTHCCVEPYVIAANRQLSEMHPIYRLLHPHFRYTMEINALARASLINAGGVIEETFFPGKYALELCAVAYGKLWRFDTEALPADLILRGMAVEDPEAEHGLRLTIEDYPYAQDGLLIWDAIKQWVSDYVNHFYSEASQVKDDTELQAWWTEVRTKGHADKKDEPWWPVLNTQEDLVHVLTTIIWVASGHHAAVNFGQYHYAGYFPNRPTIARTNMPVEDATDDEFARFWSKPEETLLCCYPSQLQAAMVMTVLDVLSTHAPDEEYLGEKAEPSWAENPTIHAAYTRFGGKLKEIEGIIEGRNATPELSNRCGAGVVPYELLKPYSKPGVTGMGVPNSISI
ncbi:linoleate 13S-lipoxygenase 2-1, chloroplastic [Canna indica]|uniref:Lipoxygenase n=1 Tax=Canna indica TaxID=4628 RepID=A0AAQ3Q1V2_9LILI|nr:linoleate 13S-lipoxygenase 2-1, chloroplastic [Canna indica]